MDLSFWLQVVPNCVTFWLGARPVARSGRCGENKRVLADKGEVLQLCEDSIARDECEWRKSSTVFAGFPTGTGPPPGTGDVMQ